MGQPPPTAGHRVPRGGERRPPEAAEGAARPVDRRSAPASRGEGPATRSPDPEAGRDHRDTRHDPAVAPAPDRPEVDVRAEAARSARDDEGNRVAHCPDGHGQSRVGLQSHPGRVEESRPSRREEHGRHGAERQKTMESRLRRAARRPGAPFCGRTGARSPGPTSSRRKSGRLEGW